VAIGKYFDLGPRHRLQILGEVEDGKYVYLAENQTPILFFLIPQRNNSSTILLVRSQSTSAEMVSAVRREVSNFDGSIPAFSVSAWSEALGIALFPARAAIVALGVFGVLALMLAITGVFGLASYFV
jgi:hypothetical protein